MMFVRRAFFLIVCMMPSLSLAAIQSGTADPEPSAVACKEKQCASKQPMTEAEAKEIALQRFLREIDENHPSVRVEDIFVETADTFIIRGYIYSQEYQKEGAYYCAVHKTSGKCVLIVPLPGPEPTRKMLKHFSWENWLVEF